MSVQSVGVSIIDVFRLVQEEKRAESVPTLRHTVDDSSSA